MDAADTSSSATRRRRITGSKFLRPAEIAESLLGENARIVRAIFFDKTPGALKVIAGSHRGGRLSAGEIKFRRQANETRLCRVKKGDCFIMRPLILHSSSAGTNPKNRRVIHFECSSESLPNGLDWYGS